MQNFAECIAGKGNFCLLCVVVTKGAQFDWPRAFRSQVSIYNNYRHLCAY